MNNALLNKQPRTGERTISVDAHRLIADLNDAAQALLRVARALERGLGNGQEHRGNGHTAPTTVGDRLTTKQLAAIHAIARRAGLSKDALARELEKLTGSPDPAVLSRSDASTAIDHLGRLADSTP